jgi:hypothetical protein
METMIRTITVAQLTAVAVVFGVTLTAEPAFPQTSAGTSKSPGWVFVPAEIANGDMARAGGPPEDDAARGGGAAQAGRAAGGRGIARGPSGDGGGVGCSHSPVCGNRVAGFDSNQKGRIQWNTTLGYEPTYPFKDLPSVGTGVPSVALDSKGNLWAFQRAPAGNPQLFKFGPAPDHKLLITVPESEITHQVKAHGMKVDAQDNVWICDETSATVRKISPEGKLLLTIGERGKRGDWDEAKGQRLLWEPLMVDWAPNGDMFIFEGHANESPNDVDGPDPWNRIGAARIIHLDKNLKFVNQWYGNSGGPGKFTQSHGSAINPKTGNVWIGDREEYRIVEYTAEGKFLRTMQTRNLICALYFDRTGQLWMGTGHDGQILKLDKDANVIGAIGTGRGRGPGKWSESSYLTMDAQGNIYSGDTSINRITKWVAPSRK